MPPTPAKLPAVSHPQMPKASLLDFCQYELPPFCVQLPTTNIDPSTQQPAVGLPPIHMASNLRAEMGSGTEGVLKTCLLNEQLTPKPLALRPCGPCPGWLLKFHQASVGREGLSTQVLPT